MMPVQAKKVEGPVEWSLKDAVERFFEKGAQDGDVITHEWLQWALDIPEPRSIDDMRRVQWLLLDRVEQLKRTLLLEHRICLANVRGEGYMIVPPSDQARYAVQSAMQSVRRELRKGESILTHTRTELLDIDAKRRHTDAEVKMAGIRSMMSRQKRDMLKPFEPVAKH